MKPITNPDITNTSQAYWNHVLRTHDLHPEVDEDDDYVGIEEIVESDAGHLGEDGEDSYDEESCP